MANSTIPTTQHEASRYSSYYHELDSTTKQRYREKMEKLGVSEDPYLAYERGPAVDVDWQNWPRVEYPDVFNFLIETPSLYTGERGFWCGRRQRVHSQERADRCFFHRR